MAEAIRAVPHIYRVEWQRRHGSGYRRATEITLIEAADAGEFQAKCAELRGRVLGSSLAKLHTCCVCGRIAPWDDNWMWCGSFKQIDDGQPVQKFCSTACRQPGNPRVPVGEVINDD